MENIKILFLDIDSVLNTSRYAENIYDEPFDDNKLVEYRVPICKDNLTALKYICENVQNLRIVWSTDWKTVDDETWNNWKNPRLWLESQEWIKSIVIGKTPKKLSSTRPEEICMWLTDNERNDKHRIFSYAVIDDYDSNAMYSWFGKHYFKTWYDNGLTIEIAVKVVDCLNNIKYDNTLFKPRVY